MSKLEIMLLSIVVFFVGALVVQVTYTSIETQVEVPTYPAGARFEVIHVPPRGDNHHSYTKESPVAVSHSCMRWTNMDGKMEIACGSIQIFGLEDYEDTIEVQAQVK